MIRKVLVAIVLSVIVGSGTWAIASSGSAPNGQPFQALWNAIDIESVWATDGNSVWTALPGYVGIGTDAPAKKLHVVGDAAFSHSATGDEEPYFFIEAGADGTPIPADGKRIGAYEEAGGAGWKTLGVDGAPLILNARSLNQLQIHGKSISINLAPSAEPAGPTEGFVLYVDSLDGNLKAKSSDNTVTTLAYK